MSLYYEAATFLSGPDQNASLKSRVYAAKNLKSTPAQLFALISEAAKWSHILKGVIEHSQLLEEERKLTPPLALLLVHDFLLARRGIAAPSTHPLRVAIARHKNRIQTAFTKARLKRKCATVTALRQLVEESGGKELWRETTGSTSQDEQKPASGYRPRWIRINTLKTTLDEQLASTFAEYQKVESLEDLCRLGGQTTLQYHLDAHVPSLIAIPGYINLTGLSAYQQGVLILQDKASCFPAYLLNVQLDDGDILDACAAPGNKTTHLAALIARSGTPITSKIWACEKDASRAKALRQMVTVAGADSVRIKAPQDFLDLDPNLELWSRIGALLLDPSCSGSGMLNRDDSLKFVLPIKQAKPAKGETPASSKEARKRKRSRATEPAVESTEDPIEESALPAQIDSEALASRLTALSSFQLKVLLHAFTFPAARKIVYSTCSIYDEENEGVVVRALSSSAAKLYRWRILKRADHVAGMKAWQLRGRVEAFGGLENAEELADACLRCERGGSDGTQGFFVAAFTRDADAGAGYGEDVVDEEWKGFSDGEAIDGVEGSG